MKKIDIYLIEKLRISKNRATGIETRLGMFIDWYCNDIDWDSDVLKTNEFARNLVEEEFGGSYKKLYDFIVEHIDDIIFVNEHKNENTEIIYNYSFTVDEYEFNIDAYVEDSYDLFSNSRFVIKENKINEKLRISSNKRIKENTEIGDLFDVNIEPHLFSWEAKNFFNTIDWNQLESYLEDYPEYNKKYINIYKPSPEVQRYGECLDLLVGCILSIPYKHDTITDGHLWSTIFDYVYDNDLLDTSSISIVIDEDLGDNYKINIHHDLDNKNAYIYFYLCKK